jgi:hypothetical protein
MLFSTVSFLGEIGHGAVTGQIYKILTLITPKFY